MSSNVILGISGAVAGGIFGGAIGFFTFDLIKSPDTNYADAIMKNLFIRSIFTTGCAGIGGSVGAIVVPMVINNK